MMANPPWLEELREQLKQQPLPAQYVERLLKELCDHFHDIQEEKQSMDAEKICAVDTRMGEPNTLAQFIGNEYHRQCFTQKHPVVMFAVMPVLLLLGVWAGLGLLAFVIVSVIGDAAESIASTFAEQLICYGSIWLPVALTSVVFGRIARHQRVGWRWALLPAATLAVFPGMTIAVTPTTMTLGILPAINLAAVIQFLLPLAIGGAYAWRGFQFQRA